MRSGIPDNTEYSTANPVGRQHPFGVNAAILGDDPIAGLLAVKLANAGHKVMLIRPSSRLSPSYPINVRLADTKGNLEVAKVDVVAHSAWAGVQDMVFLTAGCASLSQLLSELSLLSCNDTMIVAVQNGLPWWLLDAGCDIECSFDDLENQLARDRLIPAIAQATICQVEPQFFSQTMSGPFSLGDPGGLRSGLFEEAHMLMANAGIDVVVRSDIRAYAWKRMLQQLDASITHVLRRIGPSQVFKLAGTDEFRVGLSREIARLAEVLAIEVGESEASGLLAPLEADEFGLMLETIVQQAANRNLPMPAMQALSSVIGRYNGSAAGKTNDLRQTA